MMGPFRSPYDGKPYYCDECGLGWGEYTACELPTCRLETRDAAQMRKEAHDAKVQIVTTRTENARTR